MAGPSTESAARVDCIVLAGDRSNADPLAVAAGVPGKALVPVVGKAMLGHVIETLADWARVGRIILVAPDRPAYWQTALDAAGARASDLVRVTPASSLIDSVERALAQSRSSRSFLLTADHVLLDTAWLEDVLSRQGPRPASLAVGLADWHRVMARFPGSRRTRYRFSDQAACGTNLFLLNDPVGVGRILALWREVEQQRKKPWRIIALLGWANLSRYLAGRLSLEEAFRALSARVGTPIEPVLIDDPLAAVDVDSPDDLALVEQVLAGRGQQ